VTQILRQKENSTEREQEVRKRILAFSMVLALVAVMAMPIAASAEDTVITATLNNLPAVNSITPASGVQGWTYTSVEIQGTDLTGATAVTFSGTGVTASAISVASATSMTFTVTITAGATAGARDVTVTTPGGTSEVLPGGFTVVARTITVSAPANFSLGALVRGIDNKVHGPNGSVSTNAQNWQVTTSASNDGRMSNGTNSLTSRLEISKVDGAWITADGTLTYTQAGGTTLTFWAQQYVDSDDPVGTYTITITFTGSMQ
jgi:hypothetical protein